MNFILCQIIRKSVSYTHLDVYKRQAKSIEEAILMHGGEATNSKMQYQNLSPADKDALIKFLKSL